MRGSDHSYTRSLFFQDSGEKNLLTLPNGVRLTFGDVIALAGDYYGIPDAPIADPSLSPDQVDAGARQRFKDAYSTLAITPYEGKYKVCSTGKNDFQIQIGNVGFVLNTLVKFKLITTKYKA